MAGSDTHAPAGVIVTIDGPAGSGKSSTAKEVARRLGYRHLDSGALYRAITVALLSSGIPPEEWASLSETDLAELGVEMAPSDGGFSLLLRGRPLAAELRERRVTARVSGVAALPAVRAWLLGLQRQAGGLGGLVADGRDMGTVVFPHADLKVFLVADLEERARRRLLERAATSTDQASIAREAKDIDARDRQDATRIHSPLRRPVDAVEIDTTHLSLEDQVSAIVALALGLTPP